MSLKFRILIVCPCTGLPNVRNRNSHGLEKLAY